MPLQKATFYASGSQSFLRHRISNYLVLRKERSTLTPTVPYQPVVPWSHRFIQGASNPRICTRERAPCLIPRPPSCHGSGAPWHMPWVLPAPIKILRRNSAEKTDAPTPGCREPGSPPRSSGRVCLWSLATVKVPSERRARVGSCSTTRNSSTLAEGSYNKPYLACPFHL